MIEREMEDLLWEHPKHFLNEELIKFRRQASSIVGRCDLVFKDRIGRLLVVELKYGKLGREAISQLHDYYGMLKKEFRDTPIELMVVANSIPEERRLSCEKYDIDPREIPERKFREIASEVGYVFQSEASPVIEVTESRMLRSVATAKMEEGASRWSFGNSSTLSKNTSDCTDFLSRCGDNAKPFFSKLFDKQASLSKQTNLTWKHESGFSMQFYFNRLDFIPIVWGFPKFNQAGRLSNRNQSIVLPFDCAERSGVPTDFLESFGAAISGVIRLSLGARRPGFSVEGLTASKTEAVIEIIATHVEQAAHL